MGRKFGVECDLPVAPFNRSGRNMQTAGGAVILSNYQRACPVLVAGAMETVND